MRDLIVRTLSTWPGRIAAIAAIALAAALCTLCARRGGGGTAAPAVEHGEEPVQAEPSEGTPSGEVAPQYAPAPDTAYSPDNPGLSTMIMGWLVDHGFPYTASVTAISERTVDVGNGSTARLVIWSVDDGAAFIAGQLQDGEWVVWTVEGPGLPGDAAEPSMRAYDGMLSIYQTDALAELMPRELAEGFVEKWLSYAESRRVSGTSARIPVASISVEGDAASFLLVVDDFDGSVPETRFFLAACKHSKKGWKCSFEEVGADEAEAIIGEGDI